MKTRLRLIATAQRFIANSNGHPTAKTPHFARRAEFKSKNRRRRAKQNAPRKLDDPTLLERVKTGLRKFWSPEQIAGASQDDPSGCVSHFTIYRWIERQELSDAENQWLDLSQLELSKGRG